MTLSLEAVLTELSTAVTNAAPGRPAADELCSACVGLFGIDGAAVSMVYRGSSWGTFGSSSAASRRVDEHQFTFGEGPCLDAVAAREAVLVPDLGAPQERRWPLFTAAALDDGIQSVFALPIMITSVCVGALDLFRAGPGPLPDDELAGARMAADLAAGPLFDLIADASGGDIEALSDQGEGLAEIDRVEVYQATGMLISQLDVDAAEALVRLRGHAIATGQTASQVAWAIVNRDLVLDRDDLGDASRGQR